MKNLKKCPQCGETVHWRKHDSPNSYKKKKYCSPACGSKATRGRPVKARLLEKVDKDIEAPCWIFTGAKARGGYGSMGGPNGKTEAAHRVSFEIFRGAIPPSLMVLHDCDTPACVNPEHLLLGDHEDNMADRRMKDRCARGEAHGISKLTHKKVDAIRDKIEAGQTDSSIARFYGVNRTTIRDIRIGNTWT